METPERLSVRITGANSIEIVVAGEEYRLPHGVEYLRANRPKRKPTAAEIMECYRKCYGGTPEVYSDGFRNAIRRAFELAQEPK